MPLDDNATDILLIPGTNFADTIRLSQTPAGLLQVEYTDDAPTRLIQANWRDARGRPLVEQFSISTLGGNDVVEFAQGANALDLRDLTARSDDWVAVVEGGAGNDVLRGSAGRDRMDGGVGNDTLFGLGGDDRLSGDDGDGAPSDHDVLFGGQGDDDLFGGRGHNELFAWSRDPLPAGDTQFGVFVDSAGGFHDTDGDADDDGVLDNGVLNPDGTSAPYKLEDTGLNRMLGGPRADKLYGGTGLDFLYGNGEDDGEDQLFRADGTLFENLDAGLTGLDDDWKAYARQTDKVWYYGATNLDDEIHVDFVTEPGLLGDHHLITRLTRNGDATTFDAQVQLDFQAQDENGNFVWRPDDLVFDAAGARARPAGRPSAPVAGGGRLPRDHRGRPRGQRPGRRGPDRHQERLGRWRAGRRSGRDPLRPADPGRWRRGTRRATTSRRMPSSWSRSAATRRSPA